LLLAAACFFRSSDRLYRWLTTHRWFGPYIKNYREHKAVTWQTKVVTLALLWGSISYAAFRVVDSWIARLALLMIAVAVSFHVLRMKTLTKRLLHEDTTPHGTEPSGEGLDRSPERMGRARQKTEQCTR
jgi:uncharacterized membrane protein YbaN (DUF454 family)